MAEAQQPQAVKLICGMLAGSETLLTRAAEALVREFGPAELTSEVMDFDFTDYYDRQMGRPLYRQFIAFQKLIAPDALADAKCRTNAIEKRFAAKASSPPRPVNLDVGYIEPSKLVLASMKNFSHRIYLSRGVYAEITLQYHKGRWEPLSWTFPDYASGCYDAFLTAARDRLCGELTRKGLS